MNKPMNKDQQQKIILIVIVYIVALVIFNNLVIDGTNKKTNAAKQNITALKLQYSQGLMKMASMDKIKEKYDKKLSEYNDIKRAFLDENEKKVILKQIEEAGKNHNIKIETISLSKGDGAIVTNLDGTPVVDKDGREIDMTQYMEYKINMTFKASYPNLAEFIKEVEGLEKLVLIHEMDLKSDGIEISGTFLLKCYLVKEGGV